MRLQLTPDPRKKGSRKAQMCIRDRVHTMYNLAITAILMPFTKYLVKLGKWLVKAKDETAPKDAMQYACLLYTSRCV